MTRAQLGSWMKSLPRAHGLLLFGVAIASLVVAFAIVVGTGGSYEERHGVAAHGAEPVHQEQQDDLHWRSQVFRDFSEAGTPIAAEDDLSAFLRMIPVSCAVDIEALNDEEILLLFGCP